MIEYPNSRTIQDTIYTGTWSNYNIPVYTAFSANGLNQLVGYVKHINAANGTVLYRGQNTLFPSVLPSIYHSIPNYSKNKDNLDTALARMCTDDDCIKFFDLNLADINGWKLFYELVFEAALQHYGANTFCVDFVDNHWTALWFGLYEWDDIKHSYQKREFLPKAGEDDLIKMAPDPGLLMSMPDEPTPFSEEDIPVSTFSKIKQQSIDSGKPLIEFIEKIIKTQNHIHQMQWISKCNKAKKHNEPIEKVTQRFLSDNSLSHMYLFLYVAETNAPALHGVYFGKETYTLDLRKSLPSTFLRPCAQHGWIVRGKENNFCYEKNIACVIRLSTSLVNGLLGNGALVSMENFFPPISSDPGYQVLLQRQYDSPVEATERRPKIIPSGTINKYF